ncbi:MAG: hypothetical protein IJ729_05160 [Alloprevotella sp.]|nr:hypothetical protein [Alloprevotella sp.]
MERNLVMIRTFRGSGYTIGHLYCGSQRLCDTLEDEVRELPPTCPDTPQGRACGCAGKVYAQTAVPAGCYRLTFRQSPKFGRKMLALLDVPHFIGILMHGGRTAKDSAGCVLVGINSRKGELTGSKECLAALEATAKALERRGDEVYLYVINGFMA